MTLTKIGRKDKVINPLANLKSEELFQEVFDRGLVNEVDGKVTKKHLIPILKNHMTGLSRSPAMCFGDVTESMASLNLDSYEV